MSAVDALFALLERPDLQRGLRIALLVAARLAPLVFVSPWLGLRSAPSTIRTALLLGLTAAMQPFASAHAQLAPELPILALQMVREACIGAVFTLVTAAPAYALDTGGRLVDIHRGANVAEVIAPPTGERTSPLADLLLLSTLAAFAALGGLRLVFGVLASSFVDLPVGAAPASGLGAMALEAARALAYGLGLAAAFAAPAAVAILVGEAMLGLVARTVPRVSVHFLGMPLRALLGIALVLVALPSIVEDSLDALSASLAQATRMLR